MGYNKYNGRKMALGGIMAAVSIVLMLLSAVVPTMSYGLPALCGVLTTLVVIECGDRTALLMYGAVSILSLLLLPTKESAVVYLLRLRMVPRSPKGGSKASTSPVLGMGAQAGGCCDPGRCRFGCRDRDVWIGSTVRGGYRRMDDPAAVYRGRGCLRGV